MYFTGIFATLPLEISLIPLTSLCFVKLKSRQFRLSLPGNQSKRSKTVKYSCESKLKQKGMAIHR